MCDVKSTVIRIEGARTHNLKNINVEIPRNLFVAVTGPSGSGKSSLVFDTLFAEGQRQYLASLSLSTRQFLRQLDRPDVDRITGLQPTVAIDQRGRSPNARSTVGTLTEIYDYLRLLFARCGRVHCFQCHRAIEQTPLSQIVEWMMKMPERTRLMLLAPTLRQGTGRQDELFERIVKAGFFRVRINGELGDLETPPNIDAAMPHDIEVVIDRLVIKEDIRQRLTESLQLALKFGDESVIVVYETADNHWLDRPFCTRYACPHCNIRYAELEPRTFSFNSPYGACPKCEGTGCEDCGGSRLRSEARSVTFAGKGIHEICALPIEEALEFLKVPSPVGGGLNNVPSPIGGGLGWGQIAETILLQLIPRLDFLQQIGLGYLTLDRPADTLSGGELQRVRLAAGLGSGLTGVCYVLDEPTIGLHPRDNQRLIGTIKTLQQRGNTVVVVEHDDAVIREADYRIEIGPGSGKFGGYVTEPPTKVGETAALSLGSQSAGCGSANVLTLHNVQTHNLKNISVSFPLQRLTCVTGVSGSGKSSLINETLVPMLRNYLAGQSSGNLIGAEQIDKLIEVDQTPLGKNSRSNPATYSGLFDELRKLFALTKEAKRRGYQANRFSFNAGGGRCERCQGQGTQKVETDFLNDYNVVCPACNGKRFNRQTLAVKYKGASIADVLDMNIEDAFTFFENIPRIKRILCAMRQIGLGYLALGQPSSMLSGGEAQRVKLAAELALPETGKTLYILDEPTTGLHRSDVFRLLDVLSGLIDKGNTVILIEHNLDVMLASDWLIDLGPEGGSRGGCLLASGTPQDIAEWEGNVTGQFLRQFAESPRI